MKFPWIVPITVVAFVLLTGIAFAGPLDEKPKGACETVDIQSFMKDAKKEGWVTQLVPDKLGQARIKEFLLKAGPRAAFNYQPGMHVALGVRTDAESGDPIFAMVIFKAGCAVAASRLHQDWFLWWAGKSDTMPVIPDESNG